MYMSNAKLRYKNVGSDSASYLETSESRGTHPKARQMSPIRVEAEKY